MQGMGMIDVPGCSICKEYSNGLHVELFPYAQVKRYRSSQDCSETGGTPAASPLSNTAAGTFLLGMHTMHPASSLGAAPGLPAYSPRRNSRQEALAAAVILPGTSLAAAEQPASARAAAKGSSCLMYGSSAAGVTAATPSGESEIGTYPSLLAAPGTAAAGGGNVPFGVFDAGTRQTGQELQCGFTSADMGLHGELGSTTFVPVLGTCSIMQVPALASPFQAAGAAGGTGFFDIPGSPQRGASYGLAAPYSPCASPGVAATFPVASSGGKDVPAAQEVMRMSLEQLQRLWQCKIDRLQRLLKSHGAPLYQQQQQQGSTGFSGAIHSSSNNSCFSYLGDFCGSGAGVSAMPDELCAEQLMQQMVDFAGMEGLGAACSTGSFLQQGQQELMVPSSPWHGSWYDHQQQEQQQQCRKTGSAVLDLTKPGEAASPHDSCTSSPMFSLQQQSLSGCLPAAPAATPTTPLYPSPFQPPVSPTAAAAVGCVGLADAQAWLGAVRREVEGLVGVMVTMMMGSSLKWQAFMEMDMATGQPSAARQLRGHWGRMLVSDTAAMRHSQRYHNKQRSA